MFRLLLISAITGTLKSNSATFATATEMVIRSVDFEVFGRVQGVFFRKYTKEQAEKLDLRGWCKNTAQGTVLGHMQGRPDKIEIMMHWLKSTGSPSSRIDKAEFRNQKEVPEYTFDNFRVLKD